MYYIIMSTKGSTFVFICYQNNYFIKICKYNYLLKKWCIIFNSKVITSTSIMQYKYTPVKKKNFNN